jgi:hypothetical protein
MVPRLGALVVAASLAATPAGGVMLFRLKDPRLIEASGIGVGIRSPGVFYVQNDSGDSARFFALSRRTGRVVARIRVRGARNVDWEDLAVARDAAGRPSVWLADIGDNGHNRAQVQVYRVAEPTVRVGPEHDFTVPARQVWHLRYPRGRPDAESLVVAPGGRPYIITKALTGVSAVYRVPARPAARVQTLTRVGTVRFPLASGNAGPAGPFGSLLATGAALSPDGRTLVIRTYSQAYFWPVSGTGVPGALLRRPVRVALPTQPQGEGITFAGGRVVIDSERVGSPVWSVPVPALARAATPTGASTLGSGSVGASASSGIANSAHRSVALVVAGVGVAAIVLLAAAAWFFRGRTPGK